jgi:hypothetical protein
LEDFYQWRRSNSTFDGMAFFTGAGYNLSDGSTVERAQAAQVTRDMLDVLRDRCGAVAFAGRHAFAGEILG